MPPVQPQRQTVQGVVRNKGARRGPRSDAIRNRSTIVDAAVQTFRLRPEASMNDVATAAGVGRATVYGHFTSRAELVDAALSDVLRRGNDVLAALDLDGDVVTAFASLVSASWELLDESRALLEVAQKELAPDRIRALHAPLEDRVVNLIERGRSEGVFRVDLPANWQVAAMHALLQAAAAEIAAQRLSSAEAPRVLNATLLASLTR